MLKQFLFFKIARLLRHLVSLLKRTWVDFIVPIKEMATLTNTSIIIKHFWGWKKSSPPAVTKPVSASSWNGEWHSPYFTMVHLADRVDKCHAYSLFTLRCWSTGVTRNISEQCVTRLLLRVKDMLEFSFQLLARRRGSLDEMQWPRPKIPFFVQNVDPPVRDSQGDDFANRLVTMVGREKGTSFAFCQIWKGWNLQRMKFVRRSGMSICQRSLD